MATFPSYHSDSIFQSSCQSPRVQTYQHLHTISVPEQIRLSGICPPEIIAEALAHLHHSGMVILANAISATHLDTLNTTLAAESASLATDPSIRFNFGRSTGNIIQYPPLQPQLMFDDVWANPFALAIVSSLLGPQPALHYAKANTALPSDGTTSRQPVHSDLEFMHPSFPFAVVINVPLSDVGPDNGATEVWLGSHVDSSFAQQTVIDASSPTPPVASSPGAVTALAEGGSGPPVRVIHPMLLARRRLTAPPVRACTAKGSIVIRDMRLWHAGMPNFSSDARIMLAFVWEAAWWLAKGRVTMPGSGALRDIVQRWEDKGAGNAKVPVRIAVKWIGESEDRGQGADKDKEADTESESLVTCDTNIRERVIMV